jgi:hypothetical protein
MISHLKIKNLGSFNHLLPKKFEFFKFYQNKINLIELFLIKKKHTYKTWYKKDYDYNYDSVSLELKLIN